KARGRLCGSGRRLSMNTAVKGRIERLWCRAVKTVTSVALALLLGQATAASAGSWTPLVNRPSVNRIQLMVLLTDGSVMVHTFDDIQTWVKLTPDAKGSY